MFHYTDTTGFKAIVSPAVWKLRAYMPPGPHPEGAYFTTLPPMTNNLARRIRVAKWKMEQVLEFVPTSALRPIDDGKGRGEYVFYCPNDYYVEKERRRYQGSAIGYPTEAHV